jgi:hypothetical protein
MLLPKSGPKKEMSGDFIDVLEAFHAVARKDLGHP